MNLVLSIACIIVAFLAVAVMFMVFHKGKPQEEMGRIVTEDQVIEKMNTILRYNNEERF